MHCYAGDSTLHNAPASHKDRVGIASSINLDLCRLKDWGSQNLVNFNAVKTQCCLISRRVDRNLPDISFDSNSLEFRDKISMLGVTLGSHLSWNDHITTTAKAAACKLGLLFRSIRYFAPSQLLILHHIRLKFVSVSNMALICGEGPPSILLPHWMQFRSEQLN